MQHEKAHVGEQLLCPMAEDSLLNLNGHERREEQSEQGESEKSQNLLFPNHRPHTLIRHPI